MTPIEQVDCEHPSLHWKHIQCKDKIVVDLGCGRWEHIEQRDPSWPTTPEFFAKLGAKHVYAYDIDQKEIDWHKEHTCPVYCQVTAICLNIDSVNIIREIYNTHKPDTIKCDIEHNEKFLLELTDEEFSSIQQYAIETHSDQLFDSFVQKFTSLNYKITAIIDLIHARPMKVIFAERNNNV